jgi:hypothetical protein
MAVVGWQEEEEEEEEEDHALGVAKILLSAKLSGCARGKAHFVLLPLLYEKLMFPLEIVLLRVMAEMRIFHGR